MKDEKKERGKTHTQLNKGPDVDMFAPFPPGQVPGSALLCGNERCLMSPSLLPSLRSDSSEIGGIFERENLHGIRFEMRKMSSLWGRTEIAYFAGACEVHDGIGSWRVPVLFIVLWYCSRFMLARVTCGEHENGRLFSEEEEDKREREGERRKSNMCRHWRVYSSTRGYALKKKKKEVRV